MSKEFVTIGYTYTELGEQAKEKVRAWYINDYTHGDMFQEDVEEQLKYNFENSDLSVQFSLCYCQGDGLNIYGTLYLKDFLKVWECTEKERKTMDFYIGESLCEYKFSYNGRYGYSLKGNEDVEHDINEFIDYLEYGCIRNINKQLIERFYYDMIDYFSELDYKYEKAGYKYLYEPDEEEIIEMCEVNEYYFTESGSFIA